ncbi:Male-specific lethal 3 [Chamberlinius hualienensis]
MISKNGMRFKFDIGEKVLCYEPDPTKAKVLYDSKVLDLCISKDKRRRVPEYLIHFSGWSSSWDRCVTEEFILKDTQENRNLQRKLAEAAVLHIKSKKQKRKLSAILKDSYRYVKKGKHESSDDESNVSKNSDDSDSSSFSESGSDAEEEPNEEVAILNLKLPEVLKKRLEDDHSQIKQKKRLIKLPCEPTVIQILEGYVKTYATNELCVTSDHRRCHKKEDDIEININLCKEVMDGLRIYFDFMLPLVLLYIEERQQYKFYADNYFPTNSEQMELKTRVPPVNAPLEVKIEEDGGKVSASEGSSAHQHETDGLSPSLRSRKSSVQLSPQSSKLPKSPILKHIKKEPIDDSEAEIPKRTLRSAAVKQEAHSGNKPSANSDIWNSDHCSGASHSDNVKETRTPKLGTRTQPHRQAAAIAEALILKSCNTARSASSSPLPSMITQSPVHCSVNTDTSAVGKSIPNTIPAPVATRSHMSSISSCSSKSAPSSPSPISNVASSSAQKVTIALNEAMHWRMIPTSVYKQKPVPPTLLYGVQHLLRLFVKLPDMINKVNMPANKLQVLETHLESFLSYLTQRQEDFFPVNAYTEFTETFEIPSSSLASDIKDEK